jgi:hypothetical protein
MEAPDGYTDQGTREVVWISHRGDDVCAICGREIHQGNFVQANRADGLRCVVCAGYEDLSVLPAGDVELTRLAMSISSRVVVVLKWSSARKRHERQGILIDEPAYEKVLERAEAKAATKGRMAAFQVIELDGEKVLWKGSLPEGIRPS